MELMIIIVQEQDYPKLSSTFIHNRVMATKFSTEGLYLNKKNITLMVCIEKEREEEILDYIRQSCTERMEERQVCEYNGMTMVDVTKGWFSRLKCYLCNVYTHTGSPDGQR